MTYRTEVEVVDPVDPYVVERHERVVRTGNPIGTVERLIIFLFGLIELVIVLRIVLLLFAARESNDLVAAIYNISEIFVAPFRGILRIDEVQAGATALDVGASGRARRLDRHRARRARSRSRVPTDYRHYLITQLGGG